MNHDLRAIVRQFYIHGEFRGAEPFGSGHINDTYRAVVDQAGTHNRYILQRINHGIFKNPVALMENIQRVTKHLANKLAGERDVSRRVLTLVPTRSGLPYHHDEQGNYWRAYLFIERAQSFDVVESPRQAFEAARAFGQFQMLLADLPLPRLVDTIPDFHHTPQRFAALAKAVDSDAHNRAASAKAEIEFAMQRASITSVLHAAQLPERVTHNDTKINNVMLDDMTGEAVCVVDLDTLMPGLSLHDFGDMVRTATSPTKEDERDLAKVTMQLPMFEALARGYLASAAELLTDAEKKLLPLSGRLITFEIGIRFLTDYLGGDTYFKVHRDRHNLDRCRTQFKLVESIEQQEAAMSAVVEQVLVGDQG